MEKNFNAEAELKGIVSELISKLIRFIDIPSLRERIGYYVRQEYNKGMDVSEEQFGMNFIRDEKRVFSLENYVFDNIKGMTDEVAEDLRRELHQSILNFENVEQMKDRVLKVMDIAENRARAIARTEMNRAANMGQLDTARQAGVFLVKRWDVRRDACPRCKALDGVEVGLYEHFTSGKDVVDSPPLHVNCLCKMIFLQKN